jgi:4-hydroxy-3-methylbut-2-en-1-yl diphosphate synthase IspG/GcpE
MRNKMANVRLHRRRGSDGLVGVTFAFEDYHEDLPVMLEDRQYAVYDAFKWIKEEQEDVYQGLPIVRDRLHYSFIWDKYAFIKVDHGLMRDAGIRIDPTNKNINLKDEIKKLINKDKS